MGVATAFDADHRFLPPIDGVALDATWGGSSSGLGDGPQTLLDRCVAKGRRRRTARPCEEATGPNIAYNGGEAPSRC